MTVSRPGGVYSTAPTVHDGIVVRRVQAGDVEAYGILVGRYRERLYRYATRMLGNRHDAEEAVQDAFVRAFRALAHCHDVDRFEGWLFRILVNRCRTRGARSRRLAALFVDDVVAVEHAPAPETIPGERDGWSAEVARALAALSVDQREAFVLKYVEELNYEEIAALTGVGVSALKMRVKRAAARLRDLLVDAEDVHARSR